jgi:hypothetical protein
MKNAKCMNNSECVKYIKDAAKYLGLTFRRARTTNKINGLLAYVFTERRNPENVVISASTLGASLDNLESGYVEEQANKIGK